MPPPNDELPDDPFLCELSAALRSPGSAEELHHHEAALTQYRSSRVARKNAPRRFPISKALAVPATLVTFCLGGVGAAYATALPASVQHVFHQVLGPLGVPDTPKPAAITEGTRLPAPNGHDGATAGGSIAAGQHGRTNLSPANPSNRSRPPDRSSRLGASNPPASSAISSQFGNSQPAKSLAGGTESVTPAAGPWPAAPYGSSPASVPSTGTRSRTITVTASPAVVVSGSTVSLVSTVETSSGKADPNVTVTAYARTAANPTWLPAGQAKTVSTGTATITVSPVEVTTEFALVGPRGTKSAVVVVPVEDPVTLVVVSSSVDGSRRLAAAAPDASPGDTVVLQRREQATWVDVSVNKLGSNYEATFVITKAALEAGADFRAVLRPTPAHARSVSPVLTVAPAAPPPTPPTTDAPIPAAAPPAPGPAPAD